jgi:hypothetical protein
MMSLRVERRGALRAFVPDLGFFFGAAIRAGFFLRVVAFIIPVERDEYQ